MSKGIDFTIRINVDKTYILTEKLELFNIKSAVDANSECINILDEDFCDSCSQHKDDCDCEKHYDYDYDSDREYDQWKDDQMEKDSET